MSLFNPEIFFHDLLSWDYFFAALNTLWISLASLLIGLVVGLILAIARDSGIRALGVVAQAYLWLFRGTPVLLQIVFAFYVLPSLGIVLSRFACAVLALGLNEGAYVAEIIRAGLRGVGENQREAARALGLKPWYVMRFVVLPQAFRIIIPPIGNQFISMLKLTALVEVIGVQELLLVSSQAASSNFRYIEALSAAGLYYLALTTLFMAVQSRIEQALGNTDENRHRSVRFERLTEQA
jgi:polar amino acid transport system permease protein